MGIALAAILKAAASSIIGKRLQDTVTDGVVGMVRNKLNLPPEADEEQIDAALMENPEIYAQLVSEVTQRRVAVEETYRIAISEQGQSERVATQSEHAYVRNARPTMLYMAGGSIFLIIVAGLGIVAIFPDKMSGYVDLIAAIGTPLSMLMGAGGIYTYRRSTDKQIAAGAEAESLLDGLSKWTR